MTGFLEQALMGRVGSFFLVFPDCDAIVPVAQRLRTLASRNYAHASGRPWLAGHWADDECVVVGEHDRRLAVIGSLPPGEVVAAHWHEWLGIAETLPGSFHLITSAGGEVTVAGTASGARLVFSAGVGGVTVAASRADVLASLIDAGLDEIQVAVRLLSVVPHPLPLATMWRGVRAVEPGSRLSLGRDGAARTSVWWTPPVPDQSLHVAAPRLQQVLSEAVDARTEAGGTVTCDLSGGMDSTVMCFLAAGGPAKVIARTMSAGGTELAWAYHAMAHLPGVEHVVVPGEDWPLRYSGMGALTDALDEPTMAVMGRAELERFYFPLASWGGRIHLTGFGGDHVGWCTPAHYHDLFPRRPLLALRRLRGQTLGALADRQPYQKWLLNSAYQLRGSQARAGWSLGWSRPPQLPAWVTPMATTKVRKALIRAAAAAEPIASGRGAHVELSAIRQGGRWLRQVEQMCATAGLPIASPFFDDRVMRACLSIRPADRDTPRRYRPVLRAAMWGIVPDECLERTAKDVFSLPARSLAEHRADLLALWDGSCLAAMGIVDEKRLRAIVKGPMARVERGLLDTTVSVELWLRTVLSQQSRRASAQVA